jgi:PIN domain nuclease of toxin-antitoxin system
MNYLIDTHVLIWFTEGDAQLPVNIQSIIADPMNNIFVSHVSIWEIAVKKSIGKLNLSVSLTALEASLAQNGFIELPTRFAHFKEIAGLSMHHQDPFDRFLVAQAIAEDFTFITCDKKIMGFSVKLLMF